MCHHGPLTHLTEVRVSGFSFVYFVFLSKLHQLGQNQSSSSTALDIACSLILCVRREMYFNEERGRQGCCHFASSSKYCLTRPVLWRAEFCSSFTQISLGQKCCWMTLPLAVVCVLFSLWALLSRRARNYCPWIMILIIAISSFVVINSFRAR